MTTSICPTGFQKIGSWCYKNCPGTQQFERRTVGTIKKCVYTPDPTKSVELNAITPVAYGRGRVPSTPPTVASLQKSMNWLYNSYSNETTRVNEKISTILSNIEKQKRIDDAFKALQTAENARDTAPIAYQQARTAYYTLVRGDTWKAEEQERLAKAEVDPEINRMRANLADAQRRLTQQQRAVDIVNGLKDNVLTLKDDFKYSADTLQRQIGKLRDQIIFDRRKREDQNNGAIWDLLDRVLNYAIVAVLAFAAFMIYKMIKSPAPTSSTPGQTLTGGTTTKGGMRTFFMHYLPIPALR